MGQEETIPITTTEQKKLADLRQSLNRDEMQIINTMEKSRGGSLTFHEINLSLEQARQIGEL